MDIFFQNCFSQSDSMLLSISQKGQKIPLCNVPQAETNIYFRVALDMDIFTSGNETLYLMKLPVMKLSGLAIGRVSYQCTEVQKGEINYLELLVFPSSSGKFWMPRTLCWPNIYFRVDLDTDMLTKVL